MMENLDRPEWRSYTQEGIGSECGFGSRNSFIKNVKKYLGKNPSDVLKEPMIRNVEWNRQLQVVRPAVSKELFSR
jgi:AraC-like DNA-binding protein